MKGYRAFAGICVLLLLVACSLAESTNQRILLASETAVSLVQSAQVLYDAGEIDNGQRNNIVEAMRSVESFLRDATLALNSGNEAQAIQYLQVAEAALRAYDG